METGAAIKRAQEYLNLGLRAGYQLGEGGGPPNHIAPWIKMEARGGVLRQLDEMGRWLSAQSGISSLLPQVRSSLVVSLPYAGGMVDVAGFSGGILANNLGDVVIVGYPEFGVSVKTASTLLAVQRLSPNTGVAMTLAGGVEIKKALGAAGIEAVWIDRDRKPDYICMEDGQFEEWGAFENLKAHQTPEAVRAVGDSGGVGAEPLVRIVAESIDELKTMLVQILDFKEKQA